jgi:hypothetical protein
MDDFDFVLTKQHLALLRRLYIEWHPMPSEDEKGVASVNIKRPYGNSDVLGDVAEILGLRLYINEDGDEDPTVRAKALQMHREVETALQIVLATGSFRPGRYRGRFLEWRRVGAPTAKQTKRKSASRAGRAA